MAQIVYGALETINVRVVGGSKVSDYVGVACFPFPWELVFFAERHGTAGTHPGGCSIALEKLANGESPGTGVNMLENPIDLQTPAHTYQIADLSLTRSNYLGNTGDGVSLVLTGQPVGVDGIDIVVIVKHR